MATHRGQHGPERTTLVHLDNASSNWTITRDVAIPSGATAAWLDFWIDIVTQETTDSAKDTLDVELRDTAGNLLATLGTLSNAQGNQGWVWAAPTPWNLSAYAGQTVRLVLIATTDAKLPTTFNVDDVVLDIEM